MEFIRSATHFKNQSFHIYITGYPNDTIGNELKEEPRAINFTITNRRKSQSEDVARKNKGIDLNKESTSASRLIPGHDPYYTDNSKSKLLTYPGSIWISLIFSVYWKYISLCWDWIYFTNIVSKQNNIISFKFAFLSINVSRNLASW